MIKFNKKIQVFIFIIVVLGVVFVLSNKGRHTIPITPQTNNVDNQKQEKLDYLESMKAPRQFLLKQLNTNWDGYKKYLGSTTNITGNITLTKIC